MPHDICFELPTSACMLLTPAHCERVNEGRVDEAVQLCLKEVPAGNPERGRSRQRPYCCPAAGQRRLGFEQVPEGAQMHKSPPTLCSAQADLSSPAPAPLHCQWPGLLWAPPHLPRGPGSQLPCHGPCLQWECHPHHPPESCLQQKHKESLETSFGR